MTSSSGTNQIMAILVGTVKILSVLFCASHIRKFRMIVIIFCFRISLAQHEIWQPDITLYNSINHNVDYYGATNFLVEHTGHVIWVPPANFKALCDSNLRYWPFDAHTCTLQFGSWVHHGNEIDVIAKQTDAHFELFIESPEWIINEVTSGRSVVTYECCPDPYVNVQYNITIERRSSIYRTVILAPAFVIICNNSISIEFLFFWNSLYKI